ncbi:hypothetical protein [Flavobacterium capsici]|uniref:Uncharacterized protein n=1 Tax=Flavobacterium capsici TaxID=3075618 RepID=A0AA96EXY1_9FLAO|nr:MULTISPECIES: hypothetical protein [unclassified Flavobacterium]WNM19253.1 hypothetical protein RN608_00890 [Flavobacterium sp. PMR2A8]WNM20642.1 hypothetical protein RN605_08060 [Flavobacterium sp. PMTSA4]
MYLILPNKLKVTPRFIAVENNYLILDNVQYQFKDVGLAEEIYNTIMYGLDQKATFIDMKTEFDAKNLISITAFTKEVSNIKKSVLTN